MPLLSFNPRTKGLFSVLLMFSLWGVLVPANAVCDELVVGDTTHDILGTGETFSGTISGTGTIVLEHSEEEIDWTLSGNSASSWTGTIEVLEGGVLVATRDGALGAYDPESSATATVRLGDSKLVIAGPTGLGNLELKSGLAGEVQINGAYNYLYIGNLLGDGGFVKTGTGSALLLGTNENFAGDVLFKNGTITLKHDSGTGTGTWTIDGEEEDARMLNVFLSDQDTVSPVSKTIGNDIVANQSLTLYTNGTAEDTLTLSGELSGEGLIYKVGSSTLVLDGMYDQYKGSVFVGAGTVQLGLDGSGKDLVQSNFGILAGGTLFGSGTLSGLGVASGGRVVLPGASDTLIIKENMSWDQNAIISILNDGTDSGHFVIDGGAAVINGGIVRIETTGDIDFSKTFRLILAQGEDASLTVNNALSFTDNVKGMRVVGVYDEAGGYYDYSFVAFDYLEGARSPGQLQMGNYLNGIAENEAMSDSMSAALNNLEALLGNDPDLARLAYNELGGNLYASLGAAQVQATTMLNQVLAGQIRPGAKIAGRWDGTGTQRGQSFSDRGLSGWISGYGMFGNVDTDGDAAGYDLDVYGGLIGIERCSYNMKGRLGLYYGYGSTKANTGTSLGRASSDDHRIGLYLKWDGRFGYTIMTGGIAFNRVSLDRELTVVAPERLHSSFNGSQPSFYAEKGINRNFAKGILQPFIGLQYAYQGFDAISETGGTFELLNSGSYTNSLRMMLGGRFVRDIPLGRGSLQYYLQGHWMHEYLDTAGTLSANFAGVPGGGAFEVTGAGMGRDWAVLGAGLQWYINSKTNLFGSYDAQLNDRTTLHAVTAGLRTVW